MRRLRRRHRQQHRHRPSSCPGNGQQVLAPVWWHPVPPALASVVVARSIRRLGLGLLSDGCQIRASPKTTQSVSMLASMVAAYRKQIRRSAAVKAKENHHAPMPSLRYFKFLQMGSPACSSNSAIFSVFFIVLLLWGCRNKVI